MKIKTLEIRSSEKDVQIAEKVKEGTTFAKTYATSLLSGLIPHKKGNKKQGK